MRLSNLEKTDPANKYLLKVTIEILEKGVTYMFKVNNAGTRKTFCYVNLNIFHTSS